MRGASQPPPSDQPMVNMWSEKCFPKTRLDGSGLARDSRLRSRTRSKAWGADEGARQEERRSRQDRSPAGDAGDVPDG